MARHLRIGQLGEQIARDYLKNRGYKIREVNFRKSCGEIDIIAQKISCWNSGRKFSFRSFLRNLDTSQKPLTFVEVKTLVRRDHAPLSGLFPENNVHSQKKSRFLKTIQTYLAEKNYPPETDWQADVIAIILDENNRILDLQYFENIL